jgi:hypothetical protein
MPGNVQRKYPFVRAAQALFFLNAAIWFLLGVATLVRMANRSPDQRLAAGIIALFMLGNVTAMLISAVGLGKQNKWLYYLAVAVIGINILLTFTDQFGLLDFLTLVIDVVLLGMLIGFRGVYVNRLL